MKTKCKNCEAIKDKYLENCRDYRYMIDRLLDIAELHFPKYHSSDLIAEIQDIYKKYFG